MAPRVKNVKVTKNVNQWLRTDWDWSELVPLSATRHRLNARHQRRLTEKFGNKTPAISYVFTFLSTNTYSNGTYYISKLSEKYKEFYSIKIIPIFWTLRTITRGRWVIRHRKFPPPLIHSLGRLNEITWDRSYMSSGTEIYEFSN